VAKAKQAHCFISVCRNSYCKVVWQRYLGEVGKFYDTLWLVYPRRCVSISVKIGQVL